LHHNILALDLRAHGESAGEISSAGYWERHDVNQILNDLRARYPEQTQHLILFGASLGAAVAVALAAQRTDIDAIILESPFADFRRAAAAQFRLLGIELPLLHRLAISLSQKMSHADFASIAPLNLIPQSHAPILIIQGQDDALTSIDDQQQLERAISQRNDASQYWGLENVPHLMPLTSDPTTYRQRLADFLSQPQIANRQSQIENSALTSTSTHPTQ
jgi:pimeloyl-ACP methyl ester carboxylesterase